MTGRAVAIAIALAALVPRVASSESPTETAPIAAVAVVELFTSQGCSSCPPADVLLGELARQPGVMALGFHVDYWDSRRWRDRFSMPAATRRQAAYVAGQHLSTAFTPQAIVNGQRSYVGTDRAGIVTAMRARLGAPPMELRITGDALTIGLPAVPRQHRLDVNLVSYLDAASTAVNGGENGGRVLHDFNIVRDWRPLGAWTGQAISFSVARSSLQTDANRIAILVQEPHQGRIVAAMTSALR